MLKQKLFATLVRATVLFVVAVVSTTTMQAQGMGGGPPPSATVTVTPQTSNGGTMPTPPGGNPAAPVRVYSYTITSGSSLVDSIPVQLCLTGSSGTWTSFEMQFAPDGPAGNLPGVTLPADVLFTPASTCTTVNISISSGALADLGPGVDYDKNIQVQVDNPSTAPTNLNAMRAGQFRIQIRVTVEPPPMVCFVTDSDFNFLFACDGVTEVMSGNGGRFAIVANRRNIEVATNPGQFYFNGLWTNNTGSSQTVSVAFARVGVIPKGAQAIHAGLFPSFPAFDVTNFVAVNDDIPSASDDTLESVTVPAGWTLWFTYHLEWGGLGSQVPSGCATLCADANQCFSVTATVTGSGISNATCTAGACGYKK